jgi:hypothetical protein
MTKKKKTVLFTRRGKSLLSGSFGNFTFFSFFYTFSILCYFAFRNCLPEKPKIEYHTKYIMKRFFTLLFILIILGGTVFFFGWAQLPVPPGAYGVMRSKTHGVEPQINREGEFRWVWYKLIPTNVKTMVFSLNKVSRTLKSSGVLPSGGVYASLTGLSADFSWEISGQFSFSIKGEALPSLAASENIGSDEDLRTYETGLADRIEARILDFLVSYSEDSANMEALLVSGSVPGLTESVHQAFPETEGFSCLVRSTRYPDYALYRSIRSLYEDYLKQQELSFRDALSGKAESRALHRQRLDELSKYGELLTRYPILLQYLALEKGLPLLPPAESGKE